MSKLKRKEKKNHSDKQEQAGRIKKMVVFNNLKSSFGRSELLKELEFIVKMESAVTSGLVCILAIEVIG